MRAPTLYISLMILLASTAASQAANFASGPCCRPQPKWYFGISGHVTFLNDQDIRAREANEAVERAYKPGVGISGAFGYRLSPYLRGEVEAAYRSNRRDSTQLINIVPENPGKKDNSNNRTIGVMANGYFDYTNSTRFTPYVGAGFGRAQVYPRLRITYRDAGNTVIESKHISDWNWAYQFMAGVHYLVPLTTINNPSEITLGYRYFTVPEAETRFNIVNRTYRYDSVTHSLELGWRIYF